MEQLSTVSSTSCTATPPTPPLTWEEAGFMDPLPPGVEVIIPAHRRWLAFWRAEDEVLLLVRVHEQTQTRAWVCYHSAYDLRDTMPALASRLPEYTLCDALRALASQLHAWPLEDASFVAFAQHVEDACALPASLVSLLKRRMTLTDDWRQEVDPLYGFAVEHAWRLAQQLGFVCVPYDEGPTPEDTQRLWMQTSGLPERCDAQFEQWSASVLDDLQALVRLVLSAHPVLRLMGPPTTDVESGAAPSFELGAWLEPHLQGDVLSEEQLDAIAQHFEQTAKGFKMLASLDFHAELGANTCDPADFIELPDGTLTFRRVDLLLHACLSIPDTDPY